MMPDHPRDWLHETLAGGVTRRRLVGAVCAGTGLFVSGYLEREVLAQATPVTTGSRIPLGDAVGGLQPNDVWQHFHELTQIPRPSHHEEEVSAFLADFGRGLGLETIVDDVGNVIIRKPASSGLEDRPGVIFQAHMDMVPVKRSDVEHDFETDPIAAFVEDGWVRAEGTTLGADDGIGIALSMALLQDESLIHGPVEALFTVNEEDGLTGANALQPGILQGSKLINIDSEEEGTFTIGSAGGVDVDATATYAEEPAPEEMAGFRLEVAGLQGGHSGIDIDRGRGNAIKLLARLLWGLQEEIALRAATIEGGERYNAIPREAAAVVAVLKSESRRLAEAVKEFAGAVRQELDATEPDLAIMVAPTALPDMVMTQEAQRRMIGALYGSPNGVIRMSASVPGLVETSTNLGTVKVADGRLTAGFLVRSAVDSARDDVAQMIESVFDLAGAETTPHDAYSGWVPNPDSPLLGLMQSVYRDLFGHEATIMAVHAGLETSIFGEKYPGLDMISVGPTMQDVHSPNEQLEIESVGKVFDLLVATLERLAAQDGGSG